MRVGVIAKEQEKCKGYQHRLIHHMDAVAAARIHANDIQKIIRAIKVCMAERERMSELWKKGRDPLAGFRIVRMGLNPDRPALYDRINRRCEQMFRNGLVAETRSLLERYSTILSVPNSPLNALGYRQAVQMIRGELSELEAVAATQQ